MVKAFQIAIFSTEEHVQDSEILQGLRQADQNALREAVHRYTAYVGTVICNTGNGRVAFADMEELASDCFLALWESAARVLSLKAYLARCARNKTLNFLRGVRETYTLDEAAQYATPRNEVEDTDIADALSRLRPNEREVLTRHYYQNQKVAQIALALGITESAVKQRLARGREHLREELSS